MVITLPNLLEGDDMLVFIMKGECYMERRELYSREQRQENMRKLVDGLKPGDLDFNEMMFAMADTIHASFLNGLLMGRSKEEREELNDQMIELNNRLIDALNDGEKRMLITDIIVLANLIMDALNNAGLQREERQAEDEVAATK